MLVSSESTERRLHLEENFTLTKLWWWDVCARMGFLARAWRGLIGLVWLVVRVDHTLRDRKPSIIRPITGVWVEMDHIEIVQPFTQLCYPILSMVSYGVPPRSSYWGTIYRPLNMLAMLAWNAWASYIKRRFPLWKRHGSRPARTSQTNCLHYLKDGSCTLRLGTATGCLLSWQRLKPWCFFCRDFGKLMSFIRGWDCSPVWTLWHLPTLVHW